jgi:hypothetical protein
MQEDFALLPAAERVALTQHARSVGIPLVQRWTELKLGVSQEWRPRAEAAARLLLDARSVADLGCGHMLLESCLTASQLYIPVDFVRRDSRTIVCDLNREHLPTIPATHFAALGLLEYMYSIEEFVVALRTRFVGGVASFFTRRNETEVARIAAGWVNHQTDEEMRRIFQQADFTIRDVIEWRPWHFLYRVE